MLSRSEIRAKAREQLGGGIFKNAWLMVGVAILILGAIEGALAFTAIGSLIVLGPLSYGMARLQMKRVRGAEDNVQLDDLFVGFKEEFGGAILLGLLQGVFIFLWSLLFIFPGIVKTYAYSMAFFIQQDSDNKDWKFCLDESRRMMKGHKWKLFVLDLSFIGWYILGACCFGIGTFFVMPYHQMARANFYEELRNSRVEIVGSK